MVATMRAGLAMFVVLGCAADPQADALVAMEPAPAPPSPPALLPDADPAAPPADADAVESPAPSGDQPRLVVVNADDPRCEHEHTCVEVYACDFAVVARGVPAISSDGTTVLDMPYEPLPEPVVDLRWRNAASSDELRLEPVFDGNAIAARVDAHGASVCKRARVETRRRVASVNAAIGETAWRTMEPLAVEIVPGPDSAADPMPWPDERPPAERPVQARLRNQAFVLRVPGITVLQREPWSHGLDIDLGPVFADRETGIGLATYAVTSPVCSLATEAVDSRVIAIDGPAFAEIDRRAAFVSEA
jgi:hypothetical protein